MNLNWLESIFYGLISGIAEFMPISSKAHQSVWLHLCGSDMMDPVRNLLVHVGLFLALYANLKTTLDNLRRDGRLRAGKRNYPYRSRGLYDVRLVKNASLPMLIGLLVFTYAFKAEENLLLTAIFFVLNGIIIFLPGRMLQGNKDANSMSFFDSILLGVSGALSAFPGLSRIGCTTSTAIARGASRQNASYWALLLSIPALIILIGLDLLGIITFAASIPFWQSFPSYILSALFAYIGGYLGIRIMKFLSVRVGFSGFAYYSWGAGLFTFLLYLTVV